MAGIGGGCRVGALALLICAVLLSATMASGIRAGVTAAPGPAAATAQGATQVSTPPVAAAATAPPPLDDTFRDSKRKVPNGPDPIHNRRARWGDAPSKRV